MLDIKNIYKLGEMVIDPKQVFWKKQYVYACIPFVQLVKGRNYYFKVDVILTTRRNVINYKDIDTRELFDLTLTIIFVSMSL